MTIDLSKRRGQIILGREFILSADEIYLRALFSNFYPVVIDPRSLRDFYDTLSYHGYCSQFREIAEGEYIPTYKCVIHRGVGGVQTVEFIEQPKSADSGY